MMLRVAKPLLRKVIPPKMLPLWLPQCLEQAGNGGEPVRDKEGKVQIKVNSCGTSIITMDQKANALYTGIRLAGRRVERRHRFQARLRRRFGGVGAQLPDAHRQKHRFGNEGIL